MISPCSGETRHNAILGFTLVPARDLGWCRPDFRPPSALTDLALCGVSLALYRVLVPLAKPVAAAETRRSVACPYLPSTCNLSPTFVSLASSAPAGSSMTAKARHDTAMRPGRIA